MKFQLSLGLAAILSLSMVSCYPYKENPKTRKSTTQPTTAQQQAKAKEEALKKQQEEELKAKKETANKETAEKGETESTTADAPKPTNEKRSDYAFANKVPGKEGFVFSPYNNKVVDVRDIPSGTLVQDPTYPAAEKKYFRVP